MKAPQLTVRLRLALAIVATGLITALLVIATVLYAFQRFERETTFQRANTFLARIATNVELLDLHDRQPLELNTWMRSVMLYEPDSQLYLLDAQGTVLSSTGHANLAPGFKVALAPVQAAAQGASGPAAMPYVMGDDPERMALDTVVAARMLRRAVIRSGEPVSGYLYLVSRRQDLPGSRWEALRNSFAFPVLLLLLGIVVLTTALAAAIIAAVTRPLQRLTAAVAGISLTGLEQGGEPARVVGWATATASGTRRGARRNDEFGQLGSAFEMMLTTLRKQWETLRRLDHFRREGVSNLSHDLRSPLTATLACLETLEARWAAQSQSAPADRDLVAVALRNTRNAAHLVQALGDLAKLDEPQFQLRREIVDTSELIDDIGLRFAPRAAQKGITLEVQHAADLAAPFAALDVELFERAIANLIDNALKFCPAGAHVELATRQADGRVEVRVCDTGPGIAAAEQPRLFDRFYQSRASAAPAASEGGKGLGLAIVKRIVELHEGTVALSSQVGRGTEVLISLTTAHPALPQRASVSDAHHRGTNPG
ncbi:MAG: ATP-binding protein [Burkholderiaceae bacterium]